MPRRARKLDAPPAWVVHAVLTAATLLVGAATLASGDASSPYPLFYICVATAAFCFLSRAGAAIHAVLIVAAYGAALTLMPGAGTKHAASHLAVMVVSLVVGGLLLGALRVKHRNLLRRVGELASTDASTGLLDRHGLEGALSIEVERAGRSGVRFALIAIAADSLEVRSSGSAAERLAARVGPAIASSIRAVDFTGRVAGNLFLAIAIYTDERGALTLAERIRASAAVKAGADGAPSLSFGIAIYGRHGASAEELLEAGESALDAARALGGERSIIAPYRATGDGSDMTLRNPSVHVAARG